MNEEKYAPFYEMLEQSDGHTPASFLIEDWSEISENLSLSFEQIFNPSSYMDVKDVPFLYFCDIIKHFCRRQTGMCRNN